MSAPDSRSQPITDLVWRLRNLGQLSTCKEAADRIEYLEATEANEILRCKHRIEELEAALREVRLLIDEYNPMTPDWNFRRSVLHRLFDRAALPQPSTPAVSR